MQTSTTFILGCTGSGKSALGRELARRTGGEVVSLDSMKVYRRMDIGTAKPSQEARREIPHHLIDVVEPSEDFSVAKYADLAHRAIADINEREIPAFVVGGTVLYLRALTEGLFDGPGADPVIRAKLEERASINGSADLHAELRRVDPAAADRIHQNDLRRIVRALEVFELTGTPISVLQAQWDLDRPHHGFDLVGVRRPIEEQSSRTNERVRRMISAGLVDEVAGLLAEAEPLSESAQQAVGYAEIIEHLAGDISLSEATEKIKIKTRRLSKSQRTWLRRITRIEWIDLCADSTAADVADEVLERRESQ